MQEIINKLQIYFEFEFVQYALIVGVLIALCAGLIGTILVVKKFSFVGETLSHTVFGITILMSILGQIDNMVLILLLTIGITVRLLKRDKKISTDAKLAMISTGAMGLGYLALNIFGTSANLSADVCTILFGSTAILTLTQMEVVLSIILSVVVIVMFVFYYNKIFAITFDEDYALATGVNVKRYNYIIGILLAVIIVLGINLVGSLLISALIIYPVMAAMQLCKSFKNIIIFSAIFSVIGAVSGILVSILAEWPTGPTIIFVDILCYVLCYILSKIKKLV